ncbi:hypothetical protein [Candidatus Palauibacter polyketidifaciens]|uniref:hypothetical protein n=1 Tax=Candidatus Palauibacter polyketidifaciens TaxID=3056740 RepID=UPI00139BC969|nr:hypothetical protein [Candidatus Palauibacter polyketidifaciens]MDE2720961.1 hypothetical protein [Candidatus Palauibacter polyketidifaciens]MYE35461.1 hypothetical protein [Gemmatimonadales bacterium]
MKRQGGRAGAAGLLVAVSFAGVVPVVSAQEAHAGHAGSPEGGRPTTSTASIRVVDDPERKELAVILGPIDLPAHSSHHMAQLPVQEGTVPFDLTIRGYRTHIIDGHGAPVPRVVLHHMNLLDPGRRELFLPIMLRVLAASHETRPVSFPGWLFGIPMKGGSRFLALTMLHNPTEADYEGVTVHLTLEYERLARLPVYPVAPFHLDAMYPEVSATKAWDLPPGHSVKTWDASPAIRGLIIGLGGHLHAHASRLRFENLSTGDVLYDIRPRLDADGHVVDIPALLHRGRGVGALVVPEHRYRITVEYRNPFDTVIEDGGMGSIAGALIPLEDWPAANPREALFAADYDWVVRSQVEHGAVHEGHGKPAGR